MARFTALLLFSFLPYLIDAQLVQVCDTSTFGGSTSPDPPLPDIPSQYYATVEANIIQRSESLIVTEYYDQVGDRGRLEVTINGTKEIGIFDYTLGEIFLIPDPQGGDCRVYPISPTSRFLSNTFGFVETNGSLHIGSPAATLERIQGTNASIIYLGEDTIRGIPVLRWQSCVSLTNNSYLVDYYFSNSSWSYGAQTENVSMVPIQFSLNASFVGRRGTIENANHVYSFVDFQDGPSSVPDEVFSVPTGLACKGRIPGQTVPKPPETFSGRVEFIFNGDSMSPVVVTIQEFYDFRHNLFRIDYYDRTGPTSVIHDFNQGVQYKIDTNFNKCNVTRLSEIRNQLIDVAPDSDAVHLASPSQLTLLLDTFNYSYEGVTKVRGIDADSWVSVRDFERISGNSNISNAVYEVFFSRPGWVLVNGHSVSTDPAPLRTIISGDFSYVNRTDGSIVTKTMSFQYDLFDFSSEEPPYDAFDISSCSEHDDLVSIVFIIPGQLSGINVGSFRENVRASISNYTGVSPLQISSINILNENGTAIFVHVHITNLTSLATTPQEDRVTSSDALERLLAGTQDVTNPFRIQITANTSVSPSIHVSGQGRGIPNNNTCDTPTTPPATTAPPATATQPPTAPPATATLPPTTTLPATAPPMTTPPATASPRCNTTDDTTYLQKQLQLKDREIVGIAIGLLFGGMLLGAIVTLLGICICRCACKGGGKGGYDMKNRVKYQKQDNNVAI